MIMLKCWKEIIFRRDRFRWTLQNLLLNYSKGYIYFSKSKAFLQVKETKKANLLYKKHIHKWHRVPMLRSCEGSYVDSLYIAYSLFQNLFNPHTPPPTCTCLQRYYGSTHVEPCYLSNRWILLCVLCDMVSSLLKSDT